MKELKTLKDLDLRADLGLGGGLVNIKDVRQEAIKWRNRKDMDTGIVLWIDMFFNITEEDLK